MITKVAANLYIADMDGCKRAGTEAIIHACKFPCYARVMNVVDKQHPNYLFLEAPNDLYLNIIDGDRPLFYPETFEVAIKFIKRNIENRTVIIHCNKGQSRSAMIAMYYLFSDIPYFQAQEKFNELHPFFDPSFGIDQFMENYWPKK